MVKKDEWGIPKSFHSVAAGQNPIGHLKFFRFTSVTPSLPRRERKISNKNFPENV